MRALPQNAESRFHAYACQLISPCSLWIGRRGIQRTAGGRPGIQLTGIKLSRRRDADLRLEGGRNAPGGTAGAVSRPPFGRRHSTVRSPAECHASLLRHIEDKIHRRWTERPVGDHAGLIASLRPVTNAARKDRHQARQLDCRKRNLVAGGV